MVKIGFEMRLQGKESVCDLGFVLSHTWMAFWNLTLYLDLILKFQSL